MPDQKRFICTRNRQDEAYGKKKYPEMEGAEFLIHSDQLLGLENPIIYMYAFYYDNPNYSKFLTLFLITRAHLIYM